MKNHMLLEDKDLKQYLFHQGTYYSAYEYLGAHFCGDEWVFRVWAPNAATVSVVGDFNDWNTEADKAERITSQGLWECRVKNAKENQTYKFAITGKRKKKTILKSDPYAFFSQTEFLTASILHNRNDFVWTDDAWQNYKQKTNIYNSPINIYEVHLGSWKKHYDGRYYSYTDLAENLIPYVKSMGYTHIEIMPIMEHPFDGSWGYQVCGFFAPTSRYGRPEELKHFINCCHNAGIGVILDWVPAHFPKDEHGLFEFDGQPLYECQGATRKEHKGWGTRIFDYGRNEVQSFLVSNACYWIMEFHFDGLRVDAVASMLYLDYGREKGQWQPNSEGGNINLEAVAFFHKLSEALFAADNNVLLIAEESTSYPLITKPKYDGGLGFNFKWNMGWMNDILCYFEGDPYFRSGKHDKLTFGLTYAFSENFILPFSHDEVVHGKKSLLDKHCGEYNQKFSGLRSMLSFFMAHPGKKLLFMGCELGQFIEWDYRRELDWFLLEYDSHKSMQHFVRELNFLYLNEPALYSGDGGWDGFKWVCVDAASSNAAAFERIGGDEKFFVVFNFSAVDYQNYFFKPSTGAYELILNSDAKEFGGSGQKVLEEFRAVDGVYLTLPALSALFYKQKPQMIKKLKNQTEKMKTKQKTTRK